MATQAHPLSGHTKEELELRLAQALSELTGINAEVTVQNIGFHRGLVGLGSATLQLTAHFKRPETEEGDVPF